tara:strand:- start:214 stop:426 length:213 start_codon:yes stop_codon:yes gene_type:complete
VYSEKDFKICLTPNVGSICGFPGLLNKQHGLALLKDSSKAFVLALHLWNNCVVIQVFIAKKKFKKDAFLG